MRSIKTKDDIEFHSDGYRPGNPAVNVKVYSSIRDVKLPICLGGSRPANEPETEITWSYTEPGFTADWVEEHVSEHVYWDLHNMMCEDGFEQLQDEADRIWPDYSPKVYPEGRSGGWAVVHNLPDTDSWDATMLAKWRKFAKYARLVADSIPEATMTSIYFNEWEMREGS